MKALLRSLACCSVVLLLFSGWTARAATTVRTENGVWQIKLPVPFPLGFVAVYLAVGPTVVAYVLFARGLRRLSASETTTIVLAEPVTAAILAVAVLHEQLGVGSVAGIALVLSGIAALALPGRREATP